MVVLSSQSLHHRTEAVNLCRPLHGRLNCINQRAIPGLEGGSDLPTLRTTCIIHWFRYLRIQIEVKPNGGICRRWNQFRRPIVSMKESINLHCSRLPERDSHVGVCADFKSRNVFNAAGIGYCRSWFGIGIRYAEYVKRTESQTAGHTILFLVLLAVQM